MSASLFAELKRRNVIRMAGLYLVGAWLLTQVAGTVLPMFGAPDWLPRSIVILLALGFVPVMVFAWVFELTPEGIKRDAEVKPGESIAPQTARRMDRMIIVVLLLALGYFAVDKFVLAPRREAARDAAMGSESFSGGKVANKNPGHAPEKGSDAVSEAAKSVDPASRPIPTDSSIAVLPFVNMSSDKEQEYFSDGLSEELLNLLAQLPQLRVIARTSSFSFKGKEADVATIARALGVANVLEGSVRKSGNTLRITAQLIRAIDSSHLWSQTYDRELTDVFKVQDEIAGEVVGALKVRLLSDQVITNPHRSANVEAYTQYLLGNNFYDRANLDGWQHAIGAYRRAIELDGSYGAAYAGLARAGGFVADRFGDQAGMDQSFADAEKAIALAPDLADGYIARANDRISFRRDWAGAQADIEKALALSPGDSLAHLNYGGLMRTLGRMPEAMAAVRKAADLDPLSSGAWFQMGRLLNGAGDFAGARSALDRALQIAPEAEPAHYHRGITSMLEGKHEDALADFRKAGKAYGNAGIAMAEFSLGHAKEAQAALDAEISAFAAGAAYQIAEVYAWRGEADKAFEWLERALVQRDGGLSFIKIDPLMASLRNDARYAALMEKMRLPH